MINHFILKECSEDDYKNINDFFKKSGKSIFLNFMPCKITFNNYKEVFNKNYIYMGVAEDLQTSVDLLADRLNFPRLEIPHLNISDRDEVIPEGLKNDFVNNNCFEYYIYNYIYSRYKDIN